MLHRSQSRFVLLTALCYHIIRASECTASKTNHCISLLYTRSSWYLFVSINLQVIKDYKLILLVALLLVLDIVLLSTWQAIDPPARETKELQPEVSVCQAM